MGSFYWRTLYMFFDVKFPREYAHHMPSQETQLSLTNRATRLELLTFENAVTFKPGLGATEGHWKCHHSIQRM